MDMPRYAFGTPHGGSMTLFWVEDHPSDEKAIEEAMENHRNAWPELKIRQARNESESHDLLAEVTEDVPLDQTSLWGDDDRYIRGVARIVTAEHDEIYDVDDEDE
jgi:hypothetical protein